MVRVVAVAVLAMCASTASSASVGPGAAFLGPSTCGSGTQFTILFWPHGHHAIGLDNLPEILGQPHLELYSGGSRRTYSPAHFLGSAFASKVGRGSAGSFPGCRAFAPKLSSAYHGTSSTTDATALVCKFPAPPVHEAVGLVSDDVIPLFGVRYSLIERPNLRVVDARLWSNQSRLSYDSSFCHPTAPPR